MISCKDVIENIHEYYSNEINNKKKDEIKKHINVCSSCKQKYNEYKETAFMIQRSLNNIKLPKEISFNDNKYNKTKTLRFKKQLIVAACSVLLLIASLFTPAMADIKSNISDFVSKFSFGDKGIIESIESGFGQPIEMFRENNNIEFKVHSLIADDNRTEILYTIKYKGKEDFDSLTYNINAKNQSGAPVCSGYVSSFRQDTKTINGRASGDSLSRNDRNIVCCLDNIILLQKKYKEIDLLIPNKTDIDINKKICINNDQTILIKSIVFEESNLRIEYNIIPDRNINGHRPRVELYNCSEGLIYPNSSQLDLINDNEFAFVKDMYNLDKIKNKDLKLRLVYEEEIKRIDGDWEIAFKVDKKLAKKNTIKMNINEKLIFDKSKYELEKIVFTPSLTKLYINKENTDFYNCLDKFYIISDGVKYYPIRNSSSDMNKLTYEFNPLKKLDNISINVESINEEMDTYVETEFNNNTTSNTIKLYDIETKLDYQWLSEESLEIYFDGKDRVNITDAYIINEEGKKIRPDSIDTQYFKSVNNKKPEYINQIKFSSLSGENYTLVIERICVKKPVSERIPIE